MKSYPNLIMENYKLAVLQYCSHFASRFMVGLLARPLLLAPIFKIQGGSEHHQLGNPFHSDQLGYQPHYPRHFLRCESGPDSSRNVPGRVSTILEKSEILGPTWHSPGIAACDCTSSKRWVANLHTGATP